LAFLWQRRSDSEIAADIEHTLANFDCLMDQCDALFQECVAEAPKEAAKPGGEPPQPPGEQPPGEQPRIPIEQLHQLTQRLIDALGSRHESVLERIGHIYSATASGFSGCGIGAVEFRGYVACVLTQVLRELQERESRAQRAEKESPGPECKASCAEEEPGPAQEAGGEVSVLAALQGFFSSAMSGFAEAPQPEGAAGHGGSGMVCNF